MALSRIALSANKGPSPPLLLWAGKSKQPLHCTWWWLLGDDNVDHRRTKVVVVIHKNPFPAKYVTLISYAD